MNGETAISTERLLLEAVAAYVPQMHRVEWLARLLLSNGPKSSAQFDPDTGIPGAVNNPDFVEFMKSVVGGFGPFGRNDVVVSCETGELRVC